MTLSDTKLISALESWKMRCDAGLDMSRSQRELLHVIQTLIDQLPIGIRVDLMQHMADAIEDVSR